MEGADAKLTLLRARMKEAGVDAVVVGSGDAHQSEYVCDRDMRRAFISEFTGSAGTALVLADSALLWTDGRYFLQASQELSDSWTLMKSGEAGVLEMNPWICNNMPSGSVVGVDSSLICASQAVGLEKEFLAKKVTLKAMDVNLVDAVWNQVSKQPNAPMEPCIINKNHGRSHIDKIKDVQAKTAAAGADAFIVSMLDEVVWLFNIRGADVECNPVTISYAVVTSSGAHLFVAREKITDEVLAHLSIEGEVAVELHPYEIVTDFIKDLARSGTRFAVDKSQLNWGLYLAAGGESSIPLVSPLTMAKSLKNEVELDGVRQSHIRDGVALTAFLHWLEQTVRADPGSFSEYDVAQKIEEFRGSMADHVGPSFATIAGYVNM